MAKVYIKINNSNCIVDCTSDDFIKNLDGWLQIDEGVGDKYSLA